MNSNIKIAGIEINKDKLLKRFINFKNIANINVLKCYDLIFKLDAYKNNYANLILLSIILLFIITFFIFYCNDYFYLRKIMNNVIYLKLNPKLAKRLDNKKKKEGNELKGKCLSQNNNINNINSKKNKKSRKIMDRDNNANNAIRSLFRQKKSKNIKIKKSNPIKKKKITKNVFINLSNNKNKKIKNINAKNKKNKISLSLTKSSSQQKITIEDNIENNINKKEIYDIYQLISKHTDTELNSLPYKLAINLDKRSYCVYYVSLIKTKHLLFFSFLPIFDYNSRILKIFLFFFNFTVTFIVNALFFNDDTMHKIYVDHGSYDFIYNIPYNA